MLSIKNLTKIYKLSKKKGGKEVVALDRVSIDFPETGLVFLLGKSGSGKSTLLNCIGGLDKFNSGEIVIKGKSSRDFKQSDFDSYRNTFIGFIFQEYNILEEFTVGKNLALALELQGKRADKADVENLLEQVDLLEYYKRKPNQLSGGQKQRVAIARALIKDPEIIMADEPTGALDSATGKQIMETLKKLSKNKLVIIVSHDREFAEVYGDRVVELKDGKILKDDTKTEIMAKKTETGVSFIDDKIIHIKKGQQVSKDDLLKINRMLLDNINNSDTIISLDSKSNDDVKKAAAITNEGNREVFRQTESDDVAQKHYNPNEFKLIKSKLKFSDSFKMGASSLKHKPIRLIFTILLACVAFTMFGLVDTMASFNRATSVYESLNALNIKTMAVTKNYNSDGYNNSVLSINSREIDTMSSANSGYTIKPIIGTGSSFYIQGLSGTNSSDSYSINRQQLSGVMAINNSIQNTFELNIEDGRLPTVSSEICISSNMKRILIKNYDSINSWSDIQDKTLYFYISDECKYYTIVGVIKDDTDLSKYSDSEDTMATSIADFLSLSEIQTVMSYGLVNMCYVTESQFDTLSSQYFSRSLYYCQNFNAGGYESYNALYGSDIYTQGTIDNHMRNSISYMKPGISADNISGNQVIAGYDYVSVLGMTESELQSAINSGLTISFDYEAYPRGDSKAFDVTIVGYMSDYSHYMIMSESFFSEKFSGFDYVVTRLHGNSNDKNIVNYFENYKTDNITYSVQFAATPILDNFGSMITAMSQAFLYVGIGLAIFAGLMLMNFIATSIAYKKREIGVLRAIGARGKDVFSIFFSESFIICVINFILSAVIAAIACFAINNALITNLGFSVTLLTFGVRQLVLMFAVSFAVALISSFIPVFKIARKNPIDSINNR